MILCIERFEVSSGVKCSTISLHGPTTPSIHSPTIHDAFLKGHGGAGANPSRHWGERRGKIYILIHFLFCCCLLLFSLFSERPLLQFSNFLNFQFRAMTIHSPAMGYLVLTYSFFSLNLNNHNVPLHSKTTFCNWGDQRRRSKYDQSEDKLGDGRRGQQTP